MRRAFPDMHWCVEEQLPEGNTVLTRFRWSGTHQGEFREIPATNRVVRVRRPTRGALIRAWSDCLQRPLRSRF